MASGTCGFRKSKTLMVSHNTIGKPRQPPCIHKACEPTPVRISGKHILGTGALLVDLRPDSNPPFLAVASLLYFFIRASGWTLLARVHLFHHQFNSSILEPTSMTLLLLSPPRPDFFLTSQAAAIKKFF